MDSPPAFEVHHGSGAAMRHLADASIDLVLTSPPYYPAALETLLRAPLDEQTRVDEVDVGIAELAVSLAPVFAEMARVLKPEGALILQTRDIRYGGFLLGPADAHRRLAEAVGFHLQNEIAWESSPPSGARDRALRAMWRRGIFVTSEVEKLLVFTRSGRPRPGAMPIDVPEGFAEPVWRLPGQGARATHAHESPLSAMRRLVELYTVPGDLVLDPMCGHGTTLVAAMELGRRAVGYDIDPDCVAMAVTKTTKAAGRADSSR